MELNIRDKAKTIGLYGSDKGTEAGFASFLSSLFSAMLPIAGLLLMFNLIVGGFQWLASGGDSSKIENAQKRITQSLIGIIVLSGVIAIFNLVQFFIGVEFLKFVK